tara:strand:- start:2714 stop:3427 length:714 start_codon:yes stop_codon:yes gene_type:complete
MKNNLIQEETNRAKLLWGYDTKLTLNEQATGGTTDPYYCVGGVAGMSCVQSSGAPGGTTTGGPFNTLADCQTSGCGGSTPPTTPCKFTRADTCNHQGNGTSGSHLAGCMTIDGQTPTIGMSYSKGTNYPNGVERVYKVYEVNQNTATTVQDNPNTPCSGTPSTGGPTPPPTATCNKTCQQMLPGFKQKAGVRNCNWLNNRLPKLVSKLTTKTPGSCAYKRIKCKIGVLEYLITQKGC